MGCGLRKLEDPEDSSPGKIYSTLKRPQVETKTDTVYEYVLLDFSLEGSRPTVQYVSSLSELPQALQPYYTQGYVLAALHPIILSVGRTRSLPYSLLYRAILARPRPSNLKAPTCPSVPVLRVEEWPLPGDSLTGDTVRALIDRVNSSARGGVRFVGSVLQQVSGIANGRLHSPKRGCRSPPRTPPQTPPPERELEDNTYSPDLRLLVFFHSWAPGCAPLDSLACQYHQGALSMRVSRKGHVVSALEADWLELTAAYYRKGWSLVDSFVYWDTPKGEPVPRSLEGLFVYEERSTSPPANDTIVVEQWTVIEVSAGVLARQIHEAAPVLKPTTAPSFTRWQSLAGCSRVCCPRPSSDMTVTGIWPRNRSSFCSGRPEIRHPDSRGASRHLSTAQSAQVALGVTPSEVRPHQTTSAPPQEASGGSRCSAGGTPAPWPIWRKEAWSRRRGRQRSPACEQDRWMKLAVAASFKQTLT